MKHLRKFNNILDCNSNSNTNIVPYIYFISDGTVDSNDIYINNYNYNNFFSLYTELEYINSTATGGLHINLGCRLMENTDDIRIDIKFKIDGKGNDVGNGNMAHLLSSNVDISPYPGFFIRMSSNNAIEVSTKWEFSNSISYTVPETGITSYFPTNFCNNDGANYNNLSITTIDEIVEETFIFDNITVNQLSDTPTMLFCGLNSINTPFRHANAKIYYLKITKGNSVIRDLIPVKRNSDNAVGLYDKLYCVFYESLSLTPLEAGPELNNNDNTEGNE